MWVAAKALNISPFSSEFAALSQPQIMWAIANYYKDQNQDLEKFKLICRFVNPEAAKVAWDAETGEEESSADYNDFLNTIKSHTKENISDAELADRIYNPEQYDVDRIERVE